MPRKKKQPSVSPGSPVLRIPMPPQKRQRESAPAATKRKKFSDERMVQQPLFDKEGAK